MNRLLSEIVSEDKLEQYERTGDLDTSIGLEGLSRIKSTLTRPTKRDV